MKNLFLVVSIALLLAGCGRKQSPPAAAETTPKPTVMEKVKQRLVVKQHGIHPVVARWYYELHPHAFQCPNGEYGCKSCPVGKPDRVVVIQNKDKAYDVPAQINGFFACGDINRLIPEPERVDGHDVWDDSFLCEREPPDGSIEIDGHRFSCAQENEGAQHVNVGDLAPGESKGFTITVPVPDADGKK